MQIDIKPFTKEDLDFAVAQASREKWATGPHYFALHLEYEPAGAFIAWGGGERVGMITATGYASSGWLGNLIVSPEHRSRGIGRKLMKHGLDYLEAAGAKTIRLDADPPGIPLYLSLGFEEEYESRRYLWKGGSTGPAGIADRFRPGDLPEAAALDLAGFGDERGPLLEIMLGQSQAAFALKENGSLAGFLFMLQSSTGLRIGPCCAKSRAVAETLLAAALGTSGGATVGLGIPAPNRQGHKLLTSLGFEATPPCLRMARGRPEAAGNADLYYAIAGGAIG